MVVEDNPDDQFLIEHGFRKLGVTGPIHVVSDGVEAIAYMCGEGKYADRSKFPYPTFVTTDLKMPRADGFAVLEFLKKNPAWRVIPAVVLSASSDLDDIKKRLCARSELVSYQASSGRAVSPAVKNPARLLADLRGSPGRHYRKAGRDH